MNMLYRIFTLAGHRTDYEDLPTNEQLSVMRNTILSIKVGNGIIEGQDRTWVREVWKEGDLEICTGETKVTTGTPRTSTPAPSADTESAFDRQRKREAAAATGQLEDDIPF